MTSPQPHHPAVTDDAWADLRRRLHATRWPAAPEGVGWSIGADPVYLRGLVEYWANDFDWAATQAELARFPRYQVALGPDEVNVSFLHVPGVRAPGAPAPLPLILTHGWPDSSWRYLKVIDLLTDPASHGGDPADAFDVIVPDIPGYGWSPLSPELSLNAVQVAALWAELMGILGHDRYGAAGGDLGSSVSRFLALDDSEHVVGVHRMDAGLPVPGLDVGELSPAELAWVQDAQAWGAVEGAYAAVHRTKPLSVGVGFNDSPAGLAAWVVEKLYGWAECDGDPDEVFTKDEVLTLISTIWFAESETASMRMYRANAGIPLEQHARRVEVPSGFSLFGGDILMPPREWLERMTNLVWVGEPEHGGHFAPFEQPEIYAQQLRDFFRPLRAGR